MYDYVFDQHLITKGDYSLIEYKILAINKEDISSSLLYSIDGKFECGTHGRRLVSSDYVFATLEEAVDFAAKKVDNCPPTGGVIGYKKVRLFPVNPELKVIFDLWDKCSYNIGIVTLVIPKEAKRTGCYYEKKCRTEYAKVTKIEGIDKNGKLIEVDANACFGRSAYFDKKVLYKVGEMVYADDFDANKYIACSYGIHFFLTKEEAIGY